MKNIFDCIVVGAGPAGANAALVLGRARLSVLLLDDNTNRNKVTHESHGFITNDSLSPSEIRSKALSDLAKYPSILVKQSTVKSIEDNKSIFVVKTSSDTYHAKRIILATGYRETLPEIPNLKNLYGSKFFNCVFCDGWEQRDKPLAVISETSDKTLHLVKMVKHWSNDLIVFTNGNSLDIQDKKLLLDRKIVTDESPILSLQELNNNIIVQTEKMTYTVSGGFVVPVLSLRLDFLSSIKLNTTNSGLLEINDNNETSHKYIYAAGDLHTFETQLVHAASSGSRVASNIVREIAFENF